jgi:hypothetical protein
VLAFVTAAVAFVVAFVAVVAAVAGAEEATLGRLAERTAAVRTWAGWLLVGVGAWFLVLAAFAETFADVFPV